MRISIIDNKYTFPVSTQIQNEIAQRSKSTKTVWSCCSLNLPAKQNKCPICERSKPKRPTSLIGFGVVQDTIIKETYRHPNKLLAECMEEIKPIHVTETEPSLTENEKFLQEFMALLGPKAQTLEQKNKKKQESVQTVKKRKKYEAVVEKEIKAYEKRQRVGEQTPAEAVPRHPDMEKYFAECSRAVGFGAIGLLPPCWQKKNSFPATYEKWAQSETGKILYHFCKFLQTLKSNEQE